MQFGHHFPFLSRGWYLSIPAHMQHLLTNFLTSHFLSWQLTSHMRLCGYIWPWVIGWPDHLTIDDHRWPSQPWSAHFTLFTSQYHGTITTIATRGHGATARDSHTLNNDVKIIRHTENIMCCNNIAGYDTEIANFVLIWTLNTEIDTNLHQL